MTSVEIKLADFSRIEDFARVRASKGGSIDDVRLACLNETELPHYGKERVVFLAYLNGQVAGYGRVMRYSRERDGNLYSTEKPLPEGWYLRGVVVLPEFQRTGIARALTQFRLEWLRPYASDTFCFLDSEEKKTVPMYASFGFELVSSDWRFIVADLAEETGILMRKPLTREGRT